MTSSKKSTKNAEPTTSAATPEGAAVPARKRSARSAVKRAAAETVVPDSTLSAEESDAKPLGSSKPTAQTLKVRRYMSATPPSADAVIPSVARTPREELEKLPLRSRLVLAAIDEVEAVGFERFSMRRVATACGASCAAPYKHFKNRREIFVAILDHITDVWLERQAATLERVADQPLREQLLELALEYVRFMVENPRFRIILMMKDQTIDESYLQVKARISDLSKELLLRFCEETGISPKVARVKMYIVRSYMYGFALMFGNKELPYNKYMTDFIRALIEREIDLPWEAGFSPEAQVVKYLANLGPNPSDVGLEPTQFGEDG